MKQISDFCSLKHCTNLALSLEGGGARGAYQIGAIKALYENGFSFRAVVGTSIGAINAAYIAQHNFDQIYDMWYHKSFQDLFNIDNTAMKQVLTANMDLSTVKYLSKKLGEAIKNGGIDTTYERNILEQDLDESKIRSSDILFGLVTMCLSDRSGEEVFIQDIPPGKLIDYIMASSNLPVFKRSMINDKKYLDGGAWDNCPVNMLEKKGYQDVIVIRAHKRVRIRGYKNIIKRGKISIHMIEPLHTLPSILNFDSDNLRELLLLGYYDAKRSIDCLEGINYYITPISDDDMKKKIERIDIALVERMINHLNIKLQVRENIRTIFVQKALPLLVEKMRLNCVNTIKDTIYALVEYMAIQSHISKYEIYTFDTLIGEIVKKEMKQTQNELIYDFVRALV